VTGQAAAQIAAAIAYELDGWEVVPDRYGHPEWAELHGPAGDIIQLRIDPHWVQARGVHDQDLGRTRHWDVTGYRHADIGFSTTKNPARMAGELRRRLLPTVAENNRILDAEASLIAAGRAADDALFTAAAQLFPGLYWREASDRRRVEAAAYGRGDDVGVDFQLDHWRYDSHSTVTISHLTRKEVLVMIRAAAELRASATPSRPEVHRSTHRHTRRRRRTRQRTRSPR